MSCKIKRNSTGKVVSIKGNTETTSKLINDLTNLPNLNNTESIAKVYLNLEASDINLENYTKLNFKVGGKTYDSYSEMLFENVGKEFDVVIQHGENSTTILTDTLSTNEKSDKGRINNLILEGKLTGESFISKGEVHYEPSGITVTSKKQNAKDSKKQYGKHRVEITESNTLIFKEDQGIEDALTEKVNNAVEKALKNENPVQKVDLSNVENSLLNFLNNLGIKITTLDNYKKTIGLRGKNTTLVQSLADISNGIIAIAEGRESDFHEELAHIAVEHYAGQESIEELLVEVADTKEYRENYELYKDMYSEEYSGVELETRIRKEVLGKILAEKLKTKKPHVFTKIENFISEIWGNFKSKVVGKVRPYHSKSVDRLTSKIAQSVYSNDMQNFTQESKGKGLFFSLKNQSSSLNNQIDGLVRGFNALFTKASEDLSKVSFEEARHIDNQADSIRILRTADRVLASLEHVNTRVVKLRNTKHLNNIHPAVLLGYLNFTLELRDTLDSVFEGFSDSTLISEKEMWEKKISREYLEISQLQKELKAEVVELAKEELKADAKKEGIDEQEVEDALSSTSYDISKMFQWLFGISESVNMIVARVPRIMSNMMSEAGRNSLITVNPFINKIKEKGWIKHNKLLIDKTNEGDPNGNMLSPYNFSKQQELRDKFEVEELVKLTGKTEEEIKTFLKHNNSLKGLELSSDDLLAFKIAKAKNAQETRINKNNSNYYNERETEYNELGTKDATRVFLKQESSERYSILKKAYVKGIEDRSLLSATDIARLDELSVNKKKRYNPYQEIDGELKEGVTVKKIKDLTNVELSMLPAKVLDYTQNPDTDINLEIVIKDVNSTNISEEAQLTLDLNNLNYSFFGKNSGNKSKHSVEYLQTLEEKEKLGNAYDWVVANGGLTMTEEGFDLISSNVGYETDVETYVNTLSGNLKLKTENALATYKELNSIKKNLLKPYKNSDPMQELKYGLLSSDLKAKLIELENEISKSRREIALPIEHRTVSNQEVLVTLNKSIEDIAIDENKSIYEYLKDNMSESGFIELGQFKKEFDNYVIAAKKGKKGYMSKRFSEFIDESNVATNTSPAQAREFLLEAFAIKQAPSFMKEFKPKGLESLQKGLRTGNIKLSEMITDRASFNTKHPLAKYYELNPSYSWREDSSLSTTLNSEFKEDQVFDAPKEINNEFFKTFFTDTKKAIEEWKKLENDDINQLTPDKNKDAYEYLIHLTEFNKGNLELTDDVEMVSKYQLPQKMATTMERTDRVTSKKGKWSTIKESISDTFTNNEDELLEGTVMNELVGVNEARVIPKFYVNKLKDVKSISLDLAGNIGDMRVAAELYKARVKYKTKIEGTLHILEQQQFKTRFAGNKGGMTLKRGKDSNSYSMVKGKVDELLYGVQESYSVKKKVFGKEIDVTNFVSGVNRQIQYISLAFSPITDFTSLTTGIINTEIESLVGEQFNKKSLIKAKPLLSKLVVEYAVEVGSTTKKSKLSKAGELLGLFDISDRLTNTQYNRALRILAPSMSAFGLSEMANLPVGGQMLVGTMLDTKLVGDKFLFFDQFRDLERANSNNKITRKEIQTKWDNLKGETLYDHMDFSGETASPSNKLMTKFPNTFDSIFQEGINKASAKISKTNSQVDGMMSEFDKTEAKRNFLTNLLMTHKSWFYINASKRFKGKGYDWMIGKETQGAYTNIANDILPHLVKNAKKMVSLEGWKELYEELGEDEINRASIKRVMADSVILMALLAIGEMVLAGDDPDDTELENFAQLIYLRTVAEVNSSNILGMRHNLYEIIKEPVVGIDRIRSMDPAELAWNILTLDGKALSEKYDKNIIFRKRYLDFMDLDDKRNQFVRHNGEHLYNLKK